MEVMLDWSVVVADTRRSMSQLSWDSQLTVVFPGQYRRQRYTGFPHNTRIWTWISPAALHIPEIKLTSVAIGPSCQSFSDFLSRSQYLILIITVCCIKLFHWLGIDYFLKTRSLHLPETAQHLAPSISLGKKYELPFLIKMINQL